MNWTSIKEGPPVLPKDADDVYVPCIAVMAKRGDVNSYYGYYMLWYNTATGIWEDENDDKNAENNPDDWRVTHYQVLTKPTN